MCVYLRFGLQHTLGRAHRFAHDVERREEGLPLGAGLGGQHGLLCVRGCTMFAQMFEKIKGVMIVRKAQEMNTF